MKKISLLAFFAALVMTANATDLWTGSKHVSWGDGGLRIAASEFAAAQAGQKLVVTYTGASDGIEFKVMNANFDHLAGSREGAWISGDGSFEQFLTEKAVADLKAYGLEVIGANFTCTKVELLDGKTLKGGISVWTGFFWADGWTTLELYGNGYNYVDFSKMNALRIYSEAGRSDFTINIKESWEEDGGQIADMTMMTAGDGYVELPLTALRTRLSGASHWMIQFNKDGGAPFNVTDIVLVSGEMEVSAVGYASYYNSTEAYQMPNGMEGYVFNTSDGLVKEYESGKVVPAGTALILHAAEGKYPFVFATGGTAPSATNQLLGTDTVSTLPADASAYFYGLSLNSANDADSVGLYWMNATGEAFTNGAHKAYLKVAKSSAPARYYLFNGENGATGISELQEGEKASKFLENGRLFILKDGHVYDVTGRAVK